MLKSNTDCAKVNWRRRDLTKRILWCCLALVLTCGSGFAKDIKKPKPVKLKPLKPLTEKDIQKANKKGLEASSGKSIQKTNQKIFKQQAKAIREANRKAMKANKAFYKAHAKAVRDAEKRAKKSARRRRMQSSACRAG